MRRFRVRRHVAALFARGRGGNQSSLHCRTKGHDKPHCSKAALLIVGLTIFVGIVAASAHDAPAGEAPVDDASTGPRWSGTADSLRTAVTDLIETFGPKYPSGAVYLERLAALEKAGARPGGPALEQLATEALLANPLLDQLQLTLVKRPHFGGHDGFFGYMSYVKRSPAELCVLESVRHGGPARTLLRTETGCVRDPDVSFDGRRVLFAYARDEHDDYHLYEIEANNRHE